LGVEGHEGARWSTEISLHAALIPCIAYVVRREDSNDGRTSRRRINCSSEILPTLNAVKRSNTELSRLSSVSVPGSTPPAVVVVVVVVAVVGSANTSPQPFGNGGVAGGAGNDVSSASTSASPCCTCFCSG